jgi:hypothetical protein
MAMNKTQAVGVILWRGGALLAVAWGFFETGRLIVRLWDVPTQVEIALGLIISGFLMVVATLIVERVREYRAESFSE